MQYTAIPTTFAAPSNATRTVIRLVPSTSADVQILEFGVSFDGTTATNTPILIKLTKSASISGGTASSITLQSIRDSSVAGSVTANTYTAEPTYTTQVVLKQWFVPPTSGLVVQFPLGREPQRLADAAKGLELLITTTSGSGTPNVASYLEFQQGVS